MEIAICHKSRATRKTSARFKAAYPILKFRFGPRPGIHHARFYDMTSPEVSIQRISSLFQDTPYMFAGPTRSLHQKVGSFKELHCRFQTESKLVVQVLAKPRPRECMCWLMRTTLPVRCRETFLVHFQTALDAERCNNCPSPIQ